MIDENRIEGAVRQVGGHVQDAVGGLTGDARTQGEGKANEIAGQAQRAAGRAADDAREIGDLLANKVQENPLAALLITGITAFILGMMVSR